MKLFFAMRHVHTKEGGGWDCAITTGDHDADSCLHKGHWEVNDLWPLLIDGERANSHVCTLIHHLNTRGITEHLFRTAHMSKTDKTIVKRKFIINVWIHTISPPIARHSDMLMHSFPFSTHRPTSDFKLCSRGFIQSKWVRLKIAAFL